MLNLCFDLDDTLYDLARPFYEAMEQIYPETSNGTYDLEKMFADYRKYGDDIFDMIQTGILDTDKAGEIRIAKLARQYGLPVTKELAAEFQQAYKEAQTHISMSSAMQEFIETYPGKLAVITNGNTRHQKKKARTLGLYNIIPGNRIFASAQLGVRKPDPLIFEKAFDLMGEESADWFYIGDSYENDMEGGKAAGMKTIHLNRRGQKPGKCSDYTVNSEGELISLLNELNNNLLTSQ